MRFLTIGYGDQAGYDRTAPAVRDAAHAHDAWMEENRIVVAGGIAGTPVQVRNLDDTGAHTTMGPYLRADLPVAGWAVLDAESLEDAIGLAAKSPCAVAAGVIEVWPIVQPVSGEPAKS